MTVRAAEHSGFTMLEMLLAMTLMSILGASLYASLHIGFKARDRAKTALEPVRKMEIAFELLREDIESALPPTGILAGGFFGEDYEGKDGLAADVLSFCSSGHHPEPDEQACDIRRVQFEVVEEDGERRLVRLITTNLLSPETIEPVEEILCRGLLSFDVGYFDGLDWLESWDSALQGGMLPLAVEVAIEVEHTDAEGYRLCRMIPLPYGSLGTESGGTIIRSSSF